MLTRAVALLQGLWLLISRPRLQEPTGAREGTLGDGPPLRLLILGDSAAAGVGAKTQTQALTGQLTSHLAPHHSVTWRLAARCGATTKTTLARLRDLPPEPYDVVLLAVGINDAKNGVPQDSFRDTYAAILHDLRIRHNARLILCSALPPVSDFPTVPEPLRSVMGARAALFDAILQQVVADAPNADYLAFDMPRDPALLATDGLHPGAPLYTLWAKGAATRIMGALA